MSSRFEPDLVAIQDGSRSNSDSAASSSASSSPCPPLPDDVLRSLRYGQEGSIRRDRDATEAHPPSAVRRVGQSVNIDRCDATTSTATTSMTHENHTESRDRSAYSKFSDHGLDIIKAKLEVLAEDLTRKWLIRNTKIRKIETLRARCKLLGLDISQQDLEAWVNEPAGTSSTSITQTDPNQDETHAPADEPQNVEPVSISETQFAQDSETTLIEAGPASSSSTMWAEAQTSLRSMRPLRGRKRAHSQVEAQDPFSEAEDDLDSDYVEARRQSPSPDRTESLKSEDDQSNTGRGNEGPMVSVNGAATRTAWSVLVAKYPEEIALTFRAGERPTNRQVVAMLDLPAVNSLVNNPMRRARCKPWSIHDVGASRRTDHLVAALTQLTGQAAPEPCDKCEKGCGLWKGCYTRLPVSGARLDGKRVCGNCMLQGNSANCRWKQGPALPPTGIQHT